MDNLLITQHFVDLAVASNDVTKKTHNRVYPVEESVDALGHANQVTRHALFPLPF